MEWHEKQAVPYNTWKTNVTEMKRLTRVVEKVVKRWHMLIVAVPFATWKEQVVELKRLARAAEKVIKRWQLISVAVPYTTWKEQVVELKRLARAAEKVVTRWQLLSVAVPYTTWHGNVSEKKRLKRAAEKLVQRWQHMALAVPWTSWVFNADESRRLRRAAHKIIGRMKLLHLARPWTAWVLRSEERKRLKRAAELVLKRWLARGLTAPFFGWLVSSDAARVAKAKVDKIIRGWKNMSILSAFQSWSEHALSEREQREVHDREEMLLEQKRSQEGELGFQINSLGSELSASKERETQLSKKLAASWKEVSNIGRECEALRAGGENQEIAMVGAEKMLNECLSVLKVRKQKEAVLERQLSDVQASAFEVSTQLVQRDREILRVRKELGRARAAESSSLKQEEQTREQRAQQQALLMQQLSPMLHNIQVSHHISLQLQSGLEEEAAAGRLRQLTHLRLNIEGVALAAKDGAYFGLGNLWGEMDSSDPYLVIKTVNDEVLFKGEYVKKNLNPKWETFEFSVEKLGGAEALDNAEFVPKKSGPIFVLALV